MAIPDNRLSTDVHKDSYLTPDGYSRNPTEDKEQGPIEIGNTLQGLKFQEWHATFQLHTRQRKGHCQSPDDVANHSLAEVLKMKRSYSQHHNHTITITCRTLHLVIAVIRLLP